MSAALGALVDMWGQMPPDVELFSTNRGNWEVVAPKPGTVINECKWDYLKERGWGCYGHGQLLGGYTTEE